MTQFLFISEITIFAVFLASVVVFDDEHLRAFLHAEVMPSAELYIVDLADLHRDLFPCLADIERGIAFEKVSGSVKDVKPLEMASVEDIRFDGFKVRSEAGKKSPPALNKSEAWERGL